MRNVLKGRVVYIIEQMHHVVDRLSLLCICNVCNMVWTCNVFQYCPVCDCGNYRVVPIWEHAMFTHSWLKRNGIELDKENGGGDVSMLREDEIRNLKLMMKERMCAVYDEHERERTQVFISALDCVLNE